VSQKRKRREVFDLVFSRLSAQKKPTRTYGRMFIEPTTEGKHPVRSSVFYRSGSEGKKCIQTCLPVQKTYSNRRKNFQNTSSDRVFFPMLQRWEKCIVTSTRKSVV